MSATYYDMNTQAFTSGFTRERLRRATWAQVIECKGIQLAMVCADLERFDIRPEVRLDPAVLKQFRPDADRLDPALGEAWDYTLTTAWQPVKADFAIALHYRAAEDPTLGGPGMITEVLDEYGIVKAPPRAHRGFPGLIQFRMPAEAAKIALPAEEKK